MPSQLHNCAYDTSSLPNITIIVRNPHQQPEAVGNNNNKKESLAGNLKSADTLDDMSDNTR